MKRWSEFIKLALLRRRSVLNYQTMQRYVAEVSIGEIESRGVGFASSRVLELGAGLGGYSMVLNEVSLSFVASDIQSEDVFDKLNIPFQKVDVTRPFPFEEESFDLIYCSSLIEHIPAPTFMLQEAWRVLRPGGILYLSFPPFYSLSMVGGHNFKPFHFLGERLAIRVTNLLHGTKVKNYASCYGAWGLYPLTINRVERLIQDQAFELLDRYTRMSRINTAKLPGILKDLLTWHVCYLARKKTA